MNSDDSEGLGTKLYEQVEDKLYIIIILVATFFSMGFCITLAECYNAYTLSCKKNSNSTHLSREMNEI